MSENVTVMSDKKDIKLPDGTDFFLMDPGQFSFSLMQLLEVVEEDIIFWSATDLFWLDDLSDDIYTLAEYALLKDVLRINLYYVDAIHRDGYYEKVDTYEGLELGRCSDEKHCSLFLGMEMTNALYHRRLWLSVLQKHWTLWHCEREGTKKVIKLKKPCFVVKPPIARRTELSCDFADMYWHLEELTESDRELVMRHKPKDVEFYRKRK